MTLITHSPDTLALAARKAFEASFPIARLAEAALVVVVVDANDAIHYQSSRPPTMTAGMMTTEPNPIATATDAGRVEDPLDTLALDAFEAARKVADEHCVGLVVIVADRDGQHVCRRSSIAPVLTNGMLHRAASLHDIKPPPMFMPFAALAPSQSTGLPQPAPQAATGVGGPLPAPAVWDGQPRNAASQTPAPDAPAAASNAPTGEAPPSSSERPN